MGFPAMGFPALDGSPGPAYHPGHPWRGRGCSAPARIVFVRIPYAFLPLLAPRRRFAHDPGRAVRGGLMKLLAPTLAVLLAGLMVIFIGGILVMIAREFTVGTTDD